MYTNAHQAMEKHDYQLSRRLFFDTTSYVFVSFFASESSCYFQFNDISPGANDCSRSLIQDNAQRSSRLLDKHSVAK